MSALVLLLLLQMAPKAPVEGASMPAPSTTSPATPATGSAYAGAAGLGVIWAPNLAQAQASAREMKDGRILLFFTDPDCGECSRMLKIIAPSTSFFAFTRDKVPVPIAISEPSGLALAQKMRVVGVPTWIVATPDLLECSRQEGVTTQKAWVDTFVAGERGWAEYRRAVAAEAASPGDPSLVFEVARQTYQRGGRVDAESRFRRLADDAKAPAPVREQSSAYLASIDLDAGRFDDATKRLDALAAGAHDPELRERAELRRADVEIARGRRDLATYRLREFKKAHPDSPLAKEADALLEALQKPGPAPSAAPASAAPAPR